MNKQSIGLLLGILGFIVLQLLPAPSGLTVEGWEAASIVLLVVIWWMTEALPLSITALVPIALFPIFNVIPVIEAAKPYANPVILLMLGGFILSLGMQRWNLHRRISLIIISHTGSKPDHLIGGFMLASALISMWIFNTTTTVMLLPIALSVIGLVESQIQSSSREKSFKNNFSSALMIGIAYAATIGGMGTLIGTAPNAVFAGFMNETYGVEITFLKWMLVGVPMVAIMLPLTWLILVHIAFPTRFDAIPDQGDLVRKELEALGPMSKGERIVTFVLIGVACAWIFRPIIETILPGASLNDTSIAMLGALALFIIPIDIKQKTFPLDAKWATKLPWDVVILFGGGLSLAAGIKSSGLAQWIGSGTGVFSALPVIAILLGTIGLIILLTELTSNTATTATFLPIVASIAIGIGENPLLLALPAVLAASCAFMMPVATPPNAVVFASGRIRIAQLIRAGIFANCAGIAATLLLSYTAVRWVFGIEIGVLPEWLH